MRLVRSIGLLQIDSVNVLARAHLLPLFSRLGPYPVSVLDGAAWPRASRDRLLVEAWAHVASLIPLSVQPLVRWRQEQFATEPWGRVDTLRRNHPGFLDTVLAVIAEQGPSSAGDIEKALEAPGRETSGWWEWSITKTACEYLFAVGAIEGAGAVIEGALVGQGEGDGGGFDAGDAAQAREGFRVEAVDGGSGAIAGVLEGGFGGEYVAGVETGVEVVEEAEGADHESGAD